MDEEKNDLHEIIQDYEQKETAFFEQQEKLKKESQQIVKVRFFLKSLGVVLVSFLTLRLVATLIAEAGFGQEPAYWAAGGSKTSDYKVNACVFKLWNIRKAVDLYYIANKKFPETFTDLYQENFLQKHRTCPITEREYVFENEGDQAKICCPNPRDHGVQALCLKLKSGPPFILRQE